MSTGDPTWPCGCIDWSMGALVKPEKCPNCFPPIRHNFLPQWQAASKYEEVKNTFDNIRELCKKHNFSAIFLHDEVTFDGPEENREAFLKDLHIQCLGKAKELVEEWADLWPPPLLHNGKSLDHIVDAAIYSTLGAPNGKFDTRNPPSAGQIPRRTKEEKEELLNTLYGGTATGRMSSKNPGYDELLVSRFQSTQQLADRRNPNFQTSKQLLQERPDASAAWSAALRIKVRASEEARKREENMHWDPYGDWED